MSEEVNKKKNKKTLKIVGAIIIGLIFIGLVSPKTETKTSDEPAKTETAKAVEVKEPAKPTETVAQQNAVRSAKRYVGFSGFSHDGLVAQLEYEKFSNADAVYGADNSGADWNVEAEQSAKAYTSLMSFSRQGLIDQLVHDKYTVEQATHGADSVGL